jgi:hypothetical protein
MRLSLDPFKLSTVKLCYCKFCYIYCFLKIQVTAQVQSMGASWWKSTVASADQLNLPFHWVQRRGSFWKETTTTYSSGLGHVILLLFFSNSTKTFQNTIT